MKLAAIAIAISSLAGLTPAQGAAADEVLSRGRSLTQTLTQADYAEFAAREMPPEFRKRLLTNDEALRELVLDLHSNTVLAREAEAAGLGERPDVQRALREIRERLLVRALMDRAVTEAELPDFAALARQRYDTDPDAFREPERRKAAHILIRDTVARGEGCGCEPPATIEELQRRLAEGESFETLAETYSEDTRSAAHGGVMEIWAEKGKQAFVPAFQQALFALAQEGDVSGPVRTRFGTHLIKWVATQPGRVRPYDEVRDALLAQLQKEFLESKMAEKRSAAYPDLDSIDYDAIRALFERE